MPREPENHGAQVVVVTRRLGGLAIDELLDAAGK
jgi:hypothetical protein